MKVRRLARLCCVMLGLAGGAGSASAHDTWVRPLAPRLLPGQPLTAEMSAGHGLAPLSAPKRRRERSLLLLGAGRRRRPMARRRRGRRAQAAFAAAPACAVCCLALTTHEVMIAIDDDGVDAYLAEVQPPAPILHAWHAQRARAEPWVERYAKEAKGYLRVGRARAGRGGAWQRVRRLGHRLEIVPLADPTRLRPGKRLAVELREGGLPLPDTALRLFDRRGGLVVRTDAAGRAAIPGRCRGRQLLATTVLHRPAQSGAPWTSRFATLSYTVA